MSLLMGFNNWKFRKVNSSEKEKHMTYVLNILFVVLTVFLIVLIQIVSS